MLNLISEALKKKTHSFKKEKEATKEGQR